MAFKMKNQSMAKLTKAAGDSRVAMKMKAESAMKMKKESAMKKELVGKQGNLPPELKAKIEAAPTKMKSAMKKDDEMDRLIEIKRNTDPNDMDAVREINEKIRAHARKLGLKGVPDEETGGPRKKSPAKMKEKSAMKKEGGSITAFGKKYTYANAEEKKALMAKFKTMSQEKKAAEKEKKSEKAKSLMPGIKERNKQYTDLMNQGTDRSKRKAEELLNSKQPRNVGGSIDNELVKRAAEKKKQSDSAVPMYKKKK